jgi:RimJ/RimL family protein N-acetyltransferase
MTDSITSLRFSPLTPKKVPALTHVMTQQDSAYLRNFTPFPLNTGELEALVKNAVKDRYWLIEYDTCVAGLLMLRGLDAGFDRPSLGLAIAKEHAGKGLGSAAVAFALNWCRVQEIEEVVLKVADDNTAARKIYERSGFTSTGRCPRTNQLTYSVKLVSVEENYQRAGGAPLREQKREIH